MSQPDLLQLRHLVFQQPVIVFDTRWKFSRLQAIPGLQFSVSRTNMTVCGSI